MLEPLKEYICDSCHNVISAPEDGWVEWISSTDEKTGKILYKNFRICHHSDTCQKHKFAKICSDLPLSEFIGHKGIVRLLALLDQGSYHEEEYSGSKIEDMRAFVTFMRRLTIPYFEEARQLLDVARSSEFLQGSSEVHMYLPTTLKSVILEFGEE